MKKRFKGAVTVEMAIIFPAIFLIILGMLNLCIRHYQNFAAATAVMQAAARGAAYWDRIGGDGAWDFQAKGTSNSTGKMVNMDFKEHDPYRYLLDFKTDKKVANIKAYAEWLLSKNPEIQGSTTSNLRVTKEGLIFKNVSVSVTKQYIDPLHGILIKYGFDNTERYDITAKAPLNTPVEFVRDISFIYDLTKRPLSEASTE